jgi:ribosomal protein S18 acetylase RimI-like enzyme
VRIREAGPDDVDAVLALWRSARSPAARTRDDGEVIARLLETDEEALLVAERDGEVIGALIAAWDGWRGNIYRLAVAPDHRREGVATQLVNAGHRRLRARGARRVTALVGRDDDAARALWLATGYRDDAAIARFVRDL